MFRIIFLFSFIIGIFSEALGGLEYSLTDLGIGNGYKSVAQDINDQGQILFGYYIFHPEGDEYIPCLWDHGTVTPLEDQYGFINDSDQMVSHSHFWDNGLVLEIYGDFPSVMDLNDSGHYVGSVLDNQSRQVATFWSGPQTEPIILKNPEIGTIVSIAASLNNSGKIAGYYSTQMMASTEAVVWNNDSVLSLGEEYQAAFDINDNGQVVGLYTDDIGGSFLWKYGEASINLGDWTARAINNSGILVGWKTVESENPYAVVWYDGNYYNLNDLTMNINGWDLQKAVGINNAAQIIGTGIIHGEEHAFLLTPIPEPTALGLMLLGGLAMTHRQKR